MPLLHPGDRFPSLTVPLLGGGSLVLPDVLPGHFGVILFYRGRWSRTATHNCAPSNLTLGAVDLQISWADRVAITGANGAGKSTLLAALLGRVALAEGHASLGPGVVVGEVDQARGSVPR
ncbi:MAG: ATP-binding cassette domain-containing protein [Actinoallomurus sp.]